MQSASSVTVINYFSDIMRWLVAGDLYISTSATFLSA